MCSCTCSSLGLAFWMCLNFNDAIACSVDRGFSDRDDAVSRCEPLGPPPQGPSPRRKPRPSVPWPASSYWLSGLGSGIAVLYYRSSVGVLGLQRLCERWQCVHLTDFTRPPIGVRLINYQPSLATGCKLARMGSFKRDHYSIMGLWRRFLHKKNRSAIGVKLVVWQYDSLCTISQTWQLAYSSCTYNLDVNVCRLRHRTVERHCCHRGTISRHYFMMQLNSHLLRTYKIQLLRSSTTYLLF